MWLAWKRVAKEIADGTLGADFDRTERSEIQSRVADAEESAKDEVWAGYRFIVLADNSQSDGLHVIDLGAGHASASETLCGRIVTALKSQALLNESVGAGYIDRNWPPALQDSGAWALTSLRQSFLNGALTRIIDPDTVLRNKIVEFVGNRDFGLASEQKADGTFEHVWFGELIAPEEVSFEPDVFLLRKSKAAALKAKPTKAPAPDDTRGVQLPEESEEEAPEGPEVGTQTATLRLVGTVPLELWNRLGTKLIPRLRSGNNLTANVEFSVSLPLSQARSMQNDLRQVLDDLGLTSVQIERE